MKKIKRKYLKRKFLWKKKIQEKALFIKKGNCVERIITIILVLVLEMDIGIRMLSIFVILSVFVQSKFSGIYRFFGSHKKFVKNLTAFFKLLIFWSGFLCKKLLLIFLRFSFLFKIFLNEPSLKKFFIKFVNISRVIWK